MYDFHVHSKFSDDSNTEMIEMCEAAFKNNLKGLCFTDHLDYDCPGCEDIFDFNKVYDLEINSCKQKFHDKLEIFKGIELGMQPHLKDRISQFLNINSFDFIIGSIHCVNKKSMYGLSYLEGLTDIQAIDCYFNDLNECIENYSQYDVVGHVDVFRRYLSNGETSYKINNHLDILEYILKKLIHNGKGIEINTSGKRYNLVDFHPLIDIIKLYKSLGGEIITIGSDSHIPDDVGYGFDEAMYILAKSKFKYYTIFKERKPIFIKTEEERKN